MYRSIYIPVDNSAYALRGVDIGIAIAGRQGSRLTGSHVYAAGLHDRRFRQMEGGLPGRYLKEATRGGRRRGLCRLVERVPRRPKLFPHHPARRGR